VAVTGGGVDWDARSYHVVARPHLAWGTRVVDRLQLAGTETVIDAGCGSGGVTKQLLQKLPAGQVVAVDQSPSMLEEARRNLAEFGGRVEFLQADLLELDTHLHTKVDALLSTATFHWIEDHARLFEAIRNVLEPNGQLVAQCGGGANLARFVQITDQVAQQAPYAAHLSGTSLWRNYYGIEDTRARLQAAGFSDIDVWLEDSPQTFADVDEFKSFCRTVVLSRHVAALPDGLQSGFVRAVVQAVHASEGTYVLDYVRLNLDARASA
jgi:trans-aconitate 2-methyltransferase